MYEIVIQGGGQSHENLLIHGDNLLALKALEKDYRNKVKCIYIDPPYNTGSAFTHYDDNLAHSTWLSMLKPRLELLRNLLAEDGSIWISIDDDEQAYLKVLCDEVFGRKNFVNAVIWQKKYAPTNNGRWLSDSHDFVLVYAKNKEIWRPNLLPRTDEQNSRYKNFDNDSRGLWKSDNLSVANTSGYIYRITTPSGRVCYPPAGASWRVSQEKFTELVADNRIWFGSNGNNVPSIKRFLSEVKDGVTSTTIWTYQEVGHTQDAKREAKSFNSESVFATPKPEKLLERIIFLATNEGDLVLDSFLGSGTTAAVAHKMNRRWIGIEMGDHVYTHCKPRLDKVISGEDQGGISKAVNWQGGGSYRFMELAPTLVKFDKYDYPFINPEYTEEMLARAMALHENFTYAPSATIFWKQSYANENTYLYVTTQRITVELLLLIQESMLAQEYLVIACKSFDAQVVGFSSRILVKLIPQSLLEKCEFGEPINAYQQVQQNIARFNQEQYAELDFDQLLAEMAQAEAAIEGKEQDEE